MASLDLLVVQVEVGRNVPLRDHKRVPLGYWKTIKDDESPVVLVNDSLQGQSAEKAVSGVHSHGFWHRDTGSSSRAPRIAGHIPAVLWVDRQATRDVDGVRRSDSSSLLRCLA